MFTEDDLIHTYTRAEALRDGVLVDAGPLARELGFQVPRGAHRRRLARLRNTPPGCEGPGRAGAALGRALADAPRGPPGGEARDRSPVRCRRPDRTAAGAEDAPGRLRPVRRRLAVRDRDAP